MHQMPRPAPSITESMCFHENISNRRSSGIDRQASRDRQGHQSSWTLRGVAALVLMIASGWFSSQDAIGQPIFRQPKIAIQQAAQLNSKRESIPRLKPLRKVYAPSVSDSSPEKLSALQVSNGRLQGSAAGSFQEVGSDGFFLPKEGVSGNDQDTKLEIPPLDLEGLLNAQESGAGEIDDPFGENPMSEAGELEQLPMPLSQSIAPNNDADRELIKRERVIENYPNGKPKVIRSVAMDVNGNYYNDGPWKVLDQDGDAVAAGTYRRGVMQGQWVRRHEMGEGGLFSTKPFTLFQGPYDSVANFKNGKLDGQWVIYGRGRRSIFEIGYREGQRHGTATWYYPDTSRMRVATFKDGVLDGKVMQWDEDGRLSSEDLYRDGRKLVRNTSFYRPKQKKDESFYLDARLEPDGMDNWWDAKPAPYLSSGKRVQNGQTRTWYENQQLQYAGQYKADKPVGRFYWWHKNGNRSSVGQFDKDGQRFGRWIWWHENGIKQVEGDYRDDEPIGVWKSWSAEGKLIKEKDYDEPDFLESPDDEDEVGSSAEPAVVDSDMDDSDGPAGSMYSVEGKPAPLPSQLDNENDRENSAAELKGELLEEGLESISPLSESQTEETLPLPSPETSASPTNPGSLEALGDQLETIEPQARRSDGQLNALPSLRARLSGFKSAEGAQQSVNERQLSEVPQVDMATAPRLSRDLFETAVEPLRPSSEAEPEQSAAGVQLNPPTKKTTSSIEAFTLDLSE